MWNRLFASAALAASLVLPVQAQVPDNVLQMTILPGWREPDGSHIAGLSIRLADGWKTYWRAPGDGGIPPDFNWSGSTNITGVDVHFPVPQVFEQNGLRSIGYKDRVIFPLVIRTEDPEAPISLAGEVELGVCEEVCVPVTARIAADLDAPGEQSDHLRTALKDRPSQGGPMSCEITPISDGLKVVLTTGLVQMAGQEVAVVEAGEAGLWVSEATLARNGSILTATVELVPPEAKPFALARDGVRLTVLAGNRAVEVEGCD